MDPLPIPTHVGIQVVIATIVPSKIQRYIQDHDDLAFDDTKQNLGPLFLKILGIKEFCHIAYLACTEEISTMIDRLTAMSGELTSILEQDDKDMEIACEKSRLIASVVRRQPCPGPSQTPASSVTRPSQLHKNPMFWIALLRRRTSR